MERKAKALGEFCTATRIGHETLLYSLEEGSRDRAAIAANMVDEDIAMFGPTSVRACLGSRTPPTPDELAGCRITKDYECIARHMRANRDALKRAGF